jgi:hypothetical protein
MRWLGGTTPEGCDHLPAMLAPEDAAWDGVRMRSSCALMGAMAVDACPVMAPEGAARDGVPTRWQSDARYGMPSEGLPRAGLSRQWMRCP